MSLQKESLKNTIVENAGEYQDFIGNMLETQTSGFINPTISSSDTMSLNNSYNILSLNRVLLSYAYKTHGVLQTLVDQPVEDAFRGEIELVSDELDPDDIAYLKEYVATSGFLNSVKFAFKWARLYGGGGLIINTDQDPTEPLDMDEINENSPLGLIDADRWELLLSNIEMDEVATPYNYYGQPIHKSRIIKINGKEAPSYIRKRLQGWGMSELERTLRSTNSYVKNQDVIFEMLDEAKVDVYKIKGFNNALLNKNSDSIKTKVQLSNYLKNYQNALVMDKEDEYEQKQLNLGGLSDLLKENKSGVAADTKIPMTKLFGMSSSGFNAGDDDIENYNSLVESEVRTPANPILVQVYQLSCQKLFGFIPALKIKFPSLRITTPEQEENIKTSKFNRLFQLRQNGDLTPQEFMDALKQENIFTMNTKVLEGKEPVKPEMAPDINYPTVTNRMKYNFGNK